MSRGLDGGCILVDVLGCECWLLLASTSKCSSRDRHDATEKMAEGEEREAKEQRGKGATEARAVCDCDKEKERRRVIGVGQ